MSSCRTPAGNFTRSRRDSGWLSDRLRRNRSVEVACKCLRSATVGHQPGALGAVARLGREGGKRGGQVASAARDARAEHRGSRPVGIGREDGGAGGGGDERAALVVVGGVGCEDDVGAGGEFGEALLVRARVE